MGTSEASNNGLLFIKCRKIDNGKSIDFSPSREGARVQEMNGLIFHDEFAQSL